MHSSVILNHDLPDGQSHFDWLIEDPTIDAEDRLTAFRCDFRPDSDDSRPFFARKLSNHRAIYLSYEGQISNNRGKVFRVAEGRVLSQELNNATATITIQWDNQTIFYRGSRDSITDDLWRFEPRELNSSLDG
jgi:hypothetical protein